MWGNNYELAHCKILKYCKIKSFMGLRWGKDALVQTAASCYPKLLSVSRH